jgi:hypothetical protein
LAAPPHFAEVPTCEFGFVGPPTEVHFNLEPIFQYLLVGCQLSLPRAFLVLLFCFFTDMFPLCHYAGICGFGQDLTLFRNIVLTAEINAQVERARGVTTTPKLYRKLGYQAYFQTVYGYPGRGVHHPPNVCLLELTRHHILIGREVVLVVTMDDVDAPPGNNCTDEQECCSGDEADAVAVKTSVGMGDVMTAMPPHRGSRNIVTMEAAMATMTDMSPHCGSSKAVVGTVMGTKLAIPPP